MASCSCITEKPMTPLMVFDSYCWGVDKTKPRMMNPVCGKGPAWVKAIPHLSIKTVKWDQMSSSLTLCPFQGCFTPLPCSTLLHVPALVQAQAVWSGELRGKESEGTLGLRTMKSVESVPLRQHADTEACWDNAVATHWNTFTACATSKTKDQLGRRWPSKCTYLTYLWYLIVFYICLMYVYVYEKCITWGMHTAYMQTCRHAYMHTGINNAYMHTLTYVRTSRECMHAYVM